MCSARSFGEQGRGQRLVLLGVGPAGARPGDRPERHVLTLDPHQHLGRAAHEGEVVQPQIIEVRGGVERAQVAVQQQRVHGPRGLLAARQHRLERVPSLDVLEDAAHVALERLARVARRRRHRGPAVPLPLPQGERREAVRRAEPLRQLLDPGLGPLERPHPLLARRAGRHLRVGDQDGASVEVVEDDEAVGDHQHRVGQPQRVRRRRRQALDGADQVVAQVADGPAGEARQARHRDRGQRAQPLREVADGIIGLSGGAPAVAACPALHGAPAVAPRFARLGAEEGVAGPALAAHQRLEQEGERRPRHFCEHRHRRIGIEHHLTDERDDAATRRAREEVAAGVGPRGHLGAAIT